MSAPTFLETLRTVVGHMQVAHPEREAELARAHALIRLGMVTPSPDDPELGQVLSSDGHKVYHVNGVCDCDAGQHGRGCKHVHGWRLYQYVQRKLDAQAQPAQEPTSPPQAPVDTSAAVDASTALPEAPASINVRLTIDGRDCQLTLRDRDEGRLLARLQAVLQQYPAPQAPAPQRGSQRAGTGKDWCNIHNVSMKFNEGKNGQRGWHSHRTQDGQWCKGRG